MIKNIFLYNNIFLYASLQFCGNIEEYFAKRTKKLVVFIVMPRVKIKSNILRVYESGVLIKERKVWSSTNIFLYYFSWYLSYIYFTHIYFKKEEKFTVFSSHPISFFAMSLQKITRRVKFAYWIGDYFPPINLQMKLYEKLKKFYHDRVSFAYYITDRINYQINNRLIRTSNQRTIMWGVKPKEIKKKLAKDKFVILFVGLVKPSQGLENSFEFLKFHKNYFLKIIGVCDNILYDKYITIIKKYKIENQIFFPNRFFSDEELEKESQDCHIGIALYDTDKTSATYYADPGKVKAYAELGLPILMSDTSIISSYIRKYKCGEVIKINNKEFQDAIIRMKKNYSEYLKGLKKFTDYFYYEPYYDKGFLSLRQ